MKKNMGNADRIIRSIMAVVIGVLFLSGRISGIAGLGLFVFAGILLLTSFISVCPIYLTFHLHSNQRHQKS